MSYLYDHIILEDSRLMNKLSNTQLNTVKNNDQIHVFFLLNLIFRHPLLNIKKIYIKKKPKGKGTSQDNKQQYCEFVVTIDP